MNEPCRKRQGEGYVACADEGERSSMQKKKTEIITARMTPADKKAIRQRAKAAGMTVTDYLTTCALGKGIVRVEGDPEDPETGIDSSFKIYANQRRGRDSLTLIAAGNDRRFTVTALFDNLGKGASGAAVQNMNLMLGLPEETGLNL